MKYALSAVITLVRDRHGKVFGITVAGILQRAERIAENGMVPDDRLHEVMGSGYLAHLFRYYLKSHPDLLGQAA
jgi:hypothetical protein